MARTVKVYRISDDGQRVAVGAFRVNSESDVQTKWELHLATAGSGLYIATHRGIQLGVGLAILARRRSSRGMAVALGRCSFRKRAASPHRSERGKCANKRFMQCSKRRRRVA